MLNYWFRVLPKNVINQTFCPLRVFPHISTENLPDLAEPLLPFIHFSGHLSSPSEVLHVVGAFLSDCLDTVGQFSLSMYKFELKDGVKVVELENFGDKKRQKLKSRRLEESKV